MKKGKFKDLMLATKDEAIETVLDSDILPEAITTLADFVVSEGTAAIIGEVVSAIAPRVNGVILCLNWKVFGTTVAVEVTTITTRHVITRKNI